VTVTASPPQLRQLLGGLVSGGHGLGQLHLLVGGEQGYLADLLEIHPDGVVQGEVVDQGVGVHQLLFLHVGDLLGGGFLVGQVPQQQVVGADVDVQRLQGVVELVHLVALQVEVIHGVHQLGGLQLALLLSPGQQLPQFLVAAEPAGCGQGGHLLVVQAENTGLFGLLIGENPGGLLLALFSGLGGGQKRVRLPLQLPGCQFLFISHEAFLQYLSCFCFFLLQLPADRLRYCFSAPIPPEWWICNR
jgi:hypothetical protein